MAIDVCVLASGSGGNCTAVRTPAGVVLVDAGIGPRTAAGRLAGSGVGAGDVAAVCLTHLDRDHVNGNWFKTLERSGAVVYCHASRAGEVREMAAARGASVDVRGFEAGEAFEPLPGLAAVPIPFAHDSDGSHGFVLDGFGGRVGFATDLGHVPDDLVDHFCAAGGLDLLAIESNYDQRMQVDSPRPWFLKRRIMGGRGHLSNEQAYDAVRRILNRCERDGTPLPRHVVLLHRSRDCNCPDVLRRCFARDARLAPRLVLSEQDAPTPWLRAARERPFVGAQLALAFG